MCDIDRVDELVSLTYDDRFLPLIHYYNSPTSIDLSEEAEATTFSFG